MTAVIGMRELVRNSAILEQYDYVKVEDKKTHEKKGIYISQKYADDIEKFMQDKLTKEKQEKLDEIMQFAGAFEVEDRYKGLEGKELMQEVAKAKCGM
ncbi:MAG: hypothetical protein U9N02_06310 [Campylobacterota bacterium]|nr:hypothetical protein [Campylobacterota bacterium]